MNKDNLTQDIQKFTNQLLSVGAEDAAIEFLSNNISTCAFILNGIFFRKKQFDKSVEIAKLILKFNKILSNQADPEQYSNLVYLLHKSGDHEEAYRVGYDAVEKQKLSSANLFYNWGVLLKDLGKIQDAAIAFKKSREIDPEFAMTHYQLSNVLMALGEYKEGIEEDEWRFKAHSGLAKFRKRFPTPDWDGSENKTILVFSEQGYGDAIQNSRYLENLKSISNKVVLEVQEELYDLFLNSPHVDQVLSRKFLETQVPKFPDHDYVVSINSLPFWFDREYKNIKKNPYIFENKKSEAMVRLQPVFNELNKAEGKKKIGLIWAGSQWHTSDKYRSCFLKKFEPLVKIPNIKLFSFQTGPMERTWCHGKELLWEGSDNYDVVNLLEGAENIIPSIFDSMPYVKNFNDTAILLKEMDLLITVDTATAHLAGAMGVQTWLLLSNPYEWRWRKEWYQNMNYFVQPVENDWDLLVKQVSQKLKELK